MSNTRTVHRAHPSITSEQARILRAKCWLFIFEAYRAKKKAVRSNTAEDGEEIQNGFPPCPKIPQ